MFPNFINHYIEFVLFFIINTFHRLEKIFQFYWTHKHEIERICESGDTDTYEKCMQFDQWLKRTNCRKIKLFVKNQFEVTPDLNNNNNDCLAPKRIASLLNRYNDQFSENHLNQKGKRKKDDKKIVNETHGGDVDDNFDDLVLNSTLKELTDKFLELVIKVKHLHKLPIKHKECLRDIIERIFSYKLTLMWSKQLAATKYNSEIDSHTTRLIGFWNNLVKADEEQQKHSPKQPQNEFRVFPSNISSEIKSKSDIVSSRWSHVGFQGEDPGTDFRGMGLLGLIQLLHLSRKANRLPIDLLRRSLNENYSYPFAIVGINITYNLLNLFKDGYMKHLYYDENDFLFRQNKRKSQKSLKLVEALNDLYVELFLRFDSFWLESKPETIFKFKELMEKFVDIVKMDLCDRNFSLKFIY